MADVVSNGIDEAPIICCFERSEELARTIDHKIKQLREECENTKSFLRRVVREITSALDAQLAAVELRRKSISFSMNICPAPAPLGWNDFLSELPVRARNALINENIHSFAELTKKSGPEILRTPNLGRVSFRQIEQALARRNLHLAEYHD